MIFLIETNPKQKKGFIQRLFSRGMDMQYINAEPFELMKITVKSQKRIDWLRLHSSVGPDDSFIAQNGICLPDGNSLPIPDCEDAASRLLLDGAQRVIATAEKNGAALSALLIDRAAEFTHSIPSLCTVCNQLYILTDEKADYSAYSDRMLTELGTAPIILEDLGCISSCDIIIAPRGISGCGAVVLPKMIFAPSGSDCVSICRQGIVLPKALDEVDLEEYDRLSVAAAVFDCNTGEENAPHLNKMKWRDKILHSDELASVFYA